MRLPNVRHSDKGLVNVLLSNPSPEGYTSGVASFKCPHCGGPIQAPERPEQLTVDCIFCSRTIELPDRDRRIHAQQRRRQANRSHAIAVEHLRSAAIQRNRIMAIIVVSVVLTIGVVFFKVFFESSR